MLPPLSSQEEELCRVLLKVLKQAVKENDQLPIDGKEEERLASDPAREKEKGTKKGRLASDLAKGKEEERPTSDLAKGKEKKRPTSDPPVSISRLMKFCEEHGPVTAIIQSSLKSLGGGRRTERALDVMRKSVDKIGNLFSTKNDWSFKSCKEALNGCKGAASNVEESLKELNLTNKNFIDSLNAISKHIEEAIEKIENEFHELVDDKDIYRVGRYLDPIFDSVVCDFESFHLLFKDSAISEIKSICQAQDFLNQQYLHLTTIATFLSSVAATTLQITTDLGDRDSDSTLEQSATNILWMISLVFSTASTLYSLLVLTWHKSPMRRADLQHSFLFKYWLGDAPFYSLLVAVLAYSIGLCLLAFRIGHKTGLLVVPTAAVPTALTGSHAIAIFILFACFILERQWPETWNSIRAYFKDPRRLFHKSTQDRKANTKSDLPQTIGYTTNSEAVAKVSMLPARKVKRVIENEPKTGDAPFERLLQFSPDGKYLALAYDSNKVVVYDVEKSFSISSYLSEDAKLGKVTQLIWNPYQTTEECKGLLLVKSHDSVSVWNVTSPDAVCKGKYPHNVGSVHWDCTGVLLVVWTSDLRLSFLDVQCKDRQSIKLSGIKDLKIRRIIHTASVEDKDEGEDEDKDKDKDNDKDKDKKNHLLGLVRIMEDKNDEQNDYLIVLNLKTRKIVTKRRVSRGHTSITVSSGAKRVLLQGSKLGVQLIEMVDIYKEESWLETQWPRSRMEDTVTFHGREDSITVGCSKHRDWEIEVAVFLRKSSGELLALHKYTTTETKAIPESPTRFAIRPWGFSIPYMFAFSNKCGSVTIWLLPPNAALETGATPFEFQDWYNPHQNDPGSFLTLGPPTTSGVRQKQILSDKPMRS